MLETGTDIRMCIGFQNSISGLTKKSILTSLVATMDNLFTHIASPVFSASRNWGTKGRFQTSPWVSVDNRLEADWIPVLTGQ